MYHQSNLDDVARYDAQADIINVDDIATNSHNRIVLRRIKRNNANDNDELYIHNEHDAVSLNCSAYRPEGAEDMGWLGYFIGKNEHLEYLYISSFTTTSGATFRDVMEPFFRGVSRNKSIREVHFTNINLLEGEIFTMLGSFFRNNHNITSICISSCVWGDEGGRLFALALGSSTHKSLKKVQLENNNIEDEEMVEIITALSMQPRLHHLDLDGNRLRKNGCMALSTLLRCSATELQYLFISHNDINDDGIEALVPALTTCSHLKQLNICHGPLISTRGWQSLATILESTNLAELYISNNNVDDEAVAAFASALTNNHTLHTFGLSGNPITDVGWPAFSKILCDTSSVNSTFLSNHTLHYLGGEVPDNEIIEPLLLLNQRDDQKEVAMINILQCHNDFDMLPFFEWEFKCLPMVLGWLERASECDMPRDFEPNIEERKLSTIYQFVRGMPLLYVETRLRKELEDIKAEELQIEEEQLKLDQEFEQRRQLLRERKELLEESRKSIMKRIGKPNFN